MIFVIVFNVIIMEYHPCTCFHRHHALTHIWYVEAKKFVVLTGAQDCFELDNQVAICGGEIEFLALTFFSKCVFVTNPQLDTIWVLVATNL